MAGEEVEVIAVEELAAVEDKVAVTGMIAQESNQIMKQAESVSTRSYMK